MGTLSNWNNKTDHNSLTLFSVILLSLNLPISLVPVAYFTVTTRVCHTAKFSVFTHFQSSGSFFVLRHGNFWALYRRVYEVRSSQPNNSCN